LKYRGGEEGEGEGKKKDFHPMFVGSRSWASTLKIGVRSQERDFHDFVVSAALSV
jgi:hypothetical protein